MMLKHLFATAAVSSLFGGPALANNPTDYASDAGNTVTATAAKESCDNLVSSWRRLGTRSTTAGTDQVSCKVELVDGQATGYTASYIFAQSQSGIRPVSYALAMAAERAKILYNQHYGDNAAECAPVMDGPNGDRQKGMRCTFSAQ